MDREERPLGGDERQRTAADHGWPAFLVRAVVGASLRLVAMKDARGDILGGSDDRFRILGAFFGRSGDSSQKGTGTIAKSPDGWRARFRFIEQRLFAGRPSCAKVRRRQRLR